MRTQQNTTIFVFDLHDVIVKRNYRGMVHQLLKKTYRVDIISRLIFLSLSPRFIYKIYKLLQCSRVPEQCILELAFAYPSLKPLVHIIIDLVNQQCPIKLTINIIERLKKKGHALYLFSNIGERTFDHFKDNYGSVVELFDGCIVVQHHDNWVQKPHPEAFKKLIDHFNLNPKHCIFIDNNKKNILTARLQGFNTLLFQSPEKLESDLQAINILS
jgi:2-haloacid dehalogenase